MAKFNYLDKSFSQLSSYWQDFLLNNCQNELLAIDDELSKLQNNNATIYPLQDLIFRALTSVPVSQIKVVILGQDPYHGEGEANGLAFAVNDSVKLPPSLRNIYKELKLEYPEGSKMPDSELISWASQGVVLLNATLTVLKDQANSLAHIGWQSITDKIIGHISESQTNVVFMLWGSFAIRKAELIHNHRHLILTTTHPSPLSAYRGFLGCNHFKLANEYLLNNKKQPINWL